MVRESVFVHRCSQPMHKSRANGKHTRQEHERLKLLIKLIPAAIRESNSYSLHLFAFLYRSLVFATVELSRPYYWQYCQYALTRLANNLMPAFGAAARTRCPLRRGRIVPSMILCLAKTRAHLKGFEISTFTGRKPGPYNQEIGM